MSKRTGVALVIGVVLLTTITTIAQVVASRTLERSVRERELAAEFYQMRCAACHELDGGIGSPLGPRILASYGTAQLLFNYVRLAMPYDAPRTLTNEEYWQTVGHLLRSRGLVDEDTVVNQQTAEGITLNDGMTE